MKAKLLITLSLIFFLQPFHATGQSEKVTSKIIIFKNSRGTVTLHHADHTEVIGVRCIACHHRYVKAEPAACSLCHPATAAITDEKFSRVTRTDALHKRCLNCHTVTTSFRKVKPPVECDGCHSQESGTGKTK